MTLYGIYRSSERSSFFFYFSRPRTFFESYFEKSCWDLLLIFSSLFLAKCPIGKSKNNLHLRDSSVVRAVERSSEMAEPNILFKIKIFNAGS